MDVTDGENDDDDDGVVNFLPSGTQARRHFNILFYYSLFMLRTVNHNDLQRFKVVVCTSSLLLYLLLLGLCGSSGPVLFLKYLRLLRGSSVFRLFDKREPFVIVRLHFFLLRRKIERLLRRVRTIRSLLVF